MPDLLNTSITCAGYSARVLVDGKDVPHYSIEVNEEKKESICWIASESGKPFSMVVKMSPDHIERSAGFRVDGTTVARYAVPLGNNTVTATTAQVSATEDQDLIFADIDLTDDDSYLEASKATKTGELKITIEKVKLSKFDGPRGVYSLPGSDKLHERSKKGLNHQVKLGTKRTLPVIKETFKSEYLSTEATFIIRYRPLAMLQANGLTNNDTAPNSSAEKDTQASASSPKSEKRKRSEESSNTINEDSDDDEVIDVTLEEEERRLVERLNIVRSKRRKVSAQGTVKQEEETTHFTPGEIIDLT